jgi:hypothetical protein
VGYDYLTFFVEYAVEGLLALINRKKKNNQKTRSGKVIGANSSIDHTTEANSRPAASAVSKVSKVSLVVSSLLACWLVYQQYSKWYWISDQSQGTHFKEYATAILESVPKNAVLLINYDMQWTSVRYMHVCEGLRPDLTIINLSMMTYSWFKHKRSLFPHLKFPGGYYGSRAALSQNPANEEQFTLFDFINANIEEHDIYLGGKLSYPEQHLEYFYELVPIGLVRRFVPKDKLDNSSVFGEKLSLSWRTVVTALPRLPDVKKYPEETWEWTIGRDFKDRVLGKYVIVS